MKRKYADYRDKKDIVDRRLDVKRIDNEILHGYLTKLEILEVRNKWIIPNENRCILDKNYIWMGIFPDNKNYTITAMFDNNYNLKEWYFDVSKGIGIEDGIPYEDDLYLDLVVVPDGRINILDEDELKLALDNKDITIDDYNLAYDTLDFLKENYSTNIEYLNNFTNKLIKLI